MSLLDYQEELAKKASKKSDSIGFISVYVGSKGYLLRLTDVAQIGKFDKFSKLGLEKKWFLGVVAMDNDVLPVIDLATLLDVEEKYTVADLVRLNNKNQKSNWTLGVSQIGALINPQELQPLSGSTEKFVLKDYFWHKGGDRDPEIFSELDLTAILEYEDLKAVFDLGN